MLARLYATLLVITLAALVGASLATGGSSSGVGSTEPPNSGGAGLAGPGAGTGARLTLPAPTGPAPIGRIDLRLVDTSRVDPAAPTRRARELMIHVWHPAAREEGPLAPYLPRAVAAIYARQLGVPASVLGDLRTHAHSNAPAARGQHAVVLLSPGYGVSSEFDSVQAEELASRGYVVVAIDHTYEAPLVFPGGRLVLPTLAERQRDLERAPRVRLADARFVLAQLARLDRRGPLAGRLDLERIAMIGHSLGGATAASLMLVDPRVEAGVNLDGSVRGPVVGAGLDRPFMLMLGPGRLRLDGDLRRFSQSQRGPLVRVTFRDVQHAGFTDLMSLVPQLAPQVAGIRQAVPVGQAAPNRAVAAQRAYVRAFLDTYLRHRPSPLLRNGARPLANASVVVRSPRG